MDSIRLAEIVEKHKNDFQWGDDTLHGAIESAVKEALQLALVVGDKMRFSTELLKVIHDAPDHASELVVVQSIDRWPDGCVTVNLARMEPREPTGN